MVHYECRNRVFETAKEAVSYANDYFKATGIIVAVTETRKKVTHTYGREK